MSSDVNTPRVQSSKKRELTSPEFVIDTKKYRSELELIDPADLPPLPDSPGSPQPTVDMASNPASHIVIPPEEMIKLSDMLKGTFRDEIGNMVTTIVNGVLHGLQDRISSLEKQNIDLKAENTALIARVTALESQADKAEQYSRRNCLRISGYVEKKDEDIDGIILKLASDIGSNIQVQDIDRCHRLGNPNYARRSKPREIIVKFSTYRSRNEFYKMRTKLKEKGYEGVFLNEDLTKTRSKYLYEARVLMKANCIKGAWSSDGTVLIKDRSDKVHRLDSLKDLVPFGYVPANERPRAFRDVQGSSGQDFSALGGATAMD